MSLMRTALVVLFLLPYSILASLLGYPIARALGSPTLLYALGQFGARTACRLAGVRVTFKAVVKTELYKFPFVHYCLRYAGFIEVDRRDPGRSKAAIARAVASLQAGNCFIIFPEGTRSRTGELGDFKKGGFVVAIAARSRVVPVAVQGAERLMPRGRFLIQPGAVRVRVLDPVDAASYSYEDRLRLLGEVHGRIAAALAG